MDLFSQLQASLTGNQLGNAATQGMMPSPAQPRGSQQLWIQAIAAVRSQIADLHKLADSLRRMGDDENDKRVMDCTRKLQEVLLDLKDKMTNLQQGSM